MLVLSPVLGMLTNPLTTANPSLAENVTVVVDGLLQQILHGVALGNVHGQLAVVVHRAHVAAVLEEEPAGWSRRGG